MPSITFWNRLEPRPRSNDLGNALAARVRDPAWFLARQWQLGELRGEDASSPAYLKLEAETSAIVGAATGGGPASMLNGEPIERRVTTESFSKDDISLRVELGQVLERLLGASLGALIPSYRSEYPISDVAPPPAPDDPRAARLRALWRGRVVDGLAVALAWQAAPGTYPPFVTDPQKPAVSAVMTQLLDWIASVQGDLSLDDPSGWVPERLEYDARAHVFVGPNVTTLSATPDRDGKLAAHAYDEISAAPPSGLTADVQVHEATVLPGQVRFAGMPKPRFWEFEDGRVDFGGLHPDRRDLARLILMDFMLVHGTDWFLIPFEQPVGTICTSAVTVTDVFGETTVVPRADTVAGPRWTMYSTAKPGSTLATYFLLPASTGEAALDGVPLEQVRFLRDDVANMVWAVEREAEGHLGAAVAGDERGRPAEPAPPSASTPLAYRLQTNVPRNWIPFQARQLDAVSGEIALERSTLLVAPGDLPEPLGRVLTPTLAPGDPYRVREEEVPREGTRVMRLARWSRWIDGTTHLWVTRTRGVGAGEGSSGLRFDLALKPE